MTTPNECYNTTKTDSGLVLGISARPRVGDSNNDMKPSHESVSFGLIPKNAGTQWPTRKRAKIEHPTLSSASPVILEVEIARSDGLAVLSTDPRGIEISDVRRSSRTRARRGKSDDNSEDCEVSSEASEQAKSSRISSKASEQAKSSRIGPTYQVSSIPPCGSEENLENHVGGDVLWDPEMAKKARLSGQDIDKFMTNNSHLPFPVKSLVMQALHEVNYDTAKAQRRFVQVVQAARRKSTVDPYTDLTDEDRSRLEKIFKTNVRKDFPAVAKMTGYSMDTVMVQYYRWKSSNRRDYGKVKASRKDFPSNDYCEICEDGGTLIVCDLCHKAYHLECLDPPLTEVPEGSWFCRNCIVRSPARVNRSASRVKSTGSVSSNFSKSNETQNDAMKRNVDRESPRLLDRRNGNKSMSKSSQSPNDTVKRNLNIVSSGRKSGHSPILKTSESRNDKAKQNWNTDPRQKSDDSRQSVRENDHKHLGEENYVVKIDADPALPMLVQIGYDNTLNTTVFLGYKRSNDGEMGYAEKNKLFRAEGDWIRAINGTSVHGLPWNEVEPIVRAAKEKPSIVFDMVHHDPAGGAGNGQSSTTLQGTREQVNAIHAKIPQITCFPGGVDEGSVVTFGNQSHRNAAVPLTSRAQAVRQNPPTAASRNPTSTSRLTTLKGTSHDATAFPPRILGKASLVDTSNGSLQPQEAIGLKNRTLQETPATHPMENKALPTSTIDYACVSGTAVAPLNVVEATKYVHRGTNASFQPTNGSGVQAMFPNAAGIGIGSRGPEGNGDKSLLHAVGAIRNTIQGMLFCTI